MEKIFYIGFGKCGTRSFHQLMRYNRLTSVHGGQYMKHWFINENYKRISSRSISYVYDSMVDPFNINFTISKFPNSYYILPTRNLFNWLISVIYHFNYNLENINGLIIYEFIKKRNDYYILLDSLIKDNKIKNFLLIDNSRIY